MVARKPLPHGVDPSSPAGDSVPDILRPGRNTIPSSSTSPSPYSNFTAEEQSAWRQPALPAMSQDTAGPAYRPPPAPTPIPTILLQSATGSSTASGFSETNPFKRRVLAAPASATPPTPSAPPPPPPPATSQPTPPIASFSQLSMDDQTRNPWQPTAGDVSGSASTPNPVIAGSAATGPAENAWASQGTSAQPSGRTTPRMTAANARDSNLISFLPDEEGDNAGWDEVASPVAAPTTSTTSTGPPRPPFTPLAGKDATGSSEAIFEDSNAWGDLGSIGGSKPVVAEPAGDDWDLVDTEPAPGQLSRQSTWENFTDDEEDTGSGSAGARAQNKANSKAKGKSVDPAGPPAGPVVDTSQPLISIDSPPPTSQPEQSSQSIPAPAAPAATLVRTASEEEPAPRLPPRSMLDVDEEAPPRQPPRPSGSSKSETYQIKNIAWYDYRAAQNPRISPILVQNANGPCPLVALVNALSLTTPADISTSLTEMLKTREHVSLSFLLDAVFDELMSSRRSNNDSDLPDVDELYKFLKGLHTGMNVNPRFIPTHEVLTAFRRTSLTHLHPTERDDMVPGTFEDTREMQLYATFNIPLIHGWLPQKGDGAYEALDRQAASYEDVQNLLFREEELEDKLSRPDGGGLTEDEQELFQDILEIKTFLQVSATQLTPFGLEVVAKAMLPGSFAILFRNDHFSTLYRHPQTMQLLALVTDAGYASHDEVIWETLVDVNGEHADFYSGDFRIVGGNNGQQPGQRSEQYANTTGSGSGGRSSNDQGGWTTVRGRRHNASSQPADDVQPLSGEELSRHEQEDRDLALALQLQEEEEERHRADLARRNSQLSEQYIEQNARPATQSPHSSPRPSNAAGGGRYSSSQSIPVSPRRSSAGHYANNGLVVDNNASHRRTSSSSASGTALGTTYSNGQRVGQYSDGRTPSRTSSSQRVVRPLIPPSSSTAPRIVNPRPAVNRRANVDDGDDAPPSYEQAAKQAPYHPPPGAPGSESAAAGSSAAGSSSNVNLGAGASRASPSPRPPATYSSTSGRPFVTPGNYPQSYRQQQAATNRADRDCTIM